MGQTFKQLQDTALTYGAYNEADRTRIKGYLNDALVDIFGRYRWSWSEGTTTIALAAGSGTATMPSAATTSYQRGRIQKVTSPAGILVPTYVDYESTDGTSWVDEPVTASGFPSEYSIFGNTIYFNRLAPVAMQFEMTYWTEPARMVADGDEPPVPDHWRENIIFGALMRHSLRDHDMQSYGIFAKQFEGGILQMRKRDARATGAPLKVPMPPEYGGVYN